MYRDFCVALSHDAMGLSAVCDCGISCSYSLTIIETESKIQLSLITCSFRIRLLKNIYKIHLTDLKVCIKHELLSLILHLR